MRRLGTVGLLFAVVVTLPRAAQAGGFDIPDVGTEALGRGGAFVAKADSPLALYYNIAGMARQRGTRLLINANLVFHDMAFTREGSYRGTPGDPRTPWAGKPYPTIHNAAGFGYQPFAGITTDGGYFERWTFGLGVYSPPGVGKRQYGVRRTVTVKGKTEEGGLVDRETPRYEVDLPENDDGSEWTSTKPTVRAPAPSRYDIAETNLTILFPTLAVAYHPVKFLDVGAAIQWVVGSFDLMKANMSPLGESTCVGSPDYPNCDSYGNIRTTVQTVGFILSALAHPADWLDVGLTWRPQINLDSSGYIHPYPTIASGTQLNNFPATFSIKLPHILRWGVRAVSRYSDGTERADVELDGTLERWSVEDAARVRSDAFIGFGGYDDGKLVVDNPHNYKDTFSIRLGGAYNHRVSSTSRVILRWGGYYDSPTTKVDDTHLDGYTTEKVAFTVGVGLKYQGFTFDLAYAGLWMPDRVVTATPIRAGSSTNGTRWTDADPNIPVGNGRYESSLQYLSLGMTVNFEEFGRSVLYRN
ncbi:MAG: hypothetical protein EXR72_21320 [Myxococcales bacterium]|nr:hypothetical protein [Myxococcales bacterium]